MCWFSEWLSIGHLDAQIIPCSQGQEGCKQPNLMQALLTTLPLLQDSLKLFQDLLSSRSMYNKKGHYILVGDSAVDISGKCSIDDNEMLVLAAASADTVTL